MKFRKGLSINDVIFKLAGMCVGVFVSLFVCVFMCMFIRAFQKKIKVLETQFSMVFLVGHAKRGSHPKFELIWLKTRLAQST